MRTINVSYSVILIAAAIFLNSCSGGSDKPESLEAQADYYPIFTLGVQPMNLPTPVPGLQSFAWGRAGDIILMLGGRTEGFHGLTTQDSVFKTSKANPCILALDITTFKYDSVCLSNSDAAYLALLTSNTQFYQDGQFLYVIGGFGIKDTSAKRSNYTHSSLFAYPLFDMIKQVKSPGKNLSKVLASKVSSPFLQVAGGELVKIKDTFYLLFGQNYIGPYRPGVTGNYTSAIRKFRIQNGQVVDTASYIDTILHRRDLPFAPVIQKSGTFYAAFGGVFNSNAEGYVNPVYFYPGNPNQLYRQDTLTQITSQYDCARAVLYDPANDVSTTVLFGGIGQNQYDTSTNQWVKGDNGAKLPFVRTITQMTFQKGQMNQYVQLPPAPMLPELIGTNAVFFPYSNFLYSDGVIDISKITADSTAIGIIYGGIKSPKPTSSDIYPTTVNNTIYQVFIYKNQLAK